MEILRTQDLCKEYGREPNIVHALSNINITVEADEFIAIVGTSGSGKTTLLNMLGGLDRPTSGHVFVGGNDIFRMNDDELAVFRRRRIGFVFQHYNLIPALSVYQNIVLPIRLDAKEIDKKFIQSIIEALGLTAKIYNYPDDLSGGQQQRVAIARALAAKPHILLADEPTGNLDSKSGLDVIMLLKMMSEKFRQTIVMITHNTEIAQISDRIIRIEDGKVSAEARK